MQVAEWNVAVAECADTRSVCVIRTTVGEHFNWYRASRGSLGDSWASCTWHVYCHITYCGITKKCSWFFQIFINEHVNTVSAPASRLSRCRNVSVLHPMVGHTMDVRSPFFVLFDSSTGSPVHLPMLSIQAVRVLFRLRAPDIVPCIISFFRQLPCFLNHSMIGSLTWQCLTVPSLL